MLMLGFHRNNSGNTRLFKRAGAKHDMQRLANTVTDLYEVHK